MTIRIKPEAKGRRYSGADFSPLKTHYNERNFQIHVMNEYARRALEKLSVAMNLVASYFNDDKDDFIKRFFPGKKKFLERATSEQSYLRIVDDLNNDSQERIVAAETDKNMLVLAGPGSGKTRVVAHRVAYLLRVKRIKPEAILVLCFNRSAVMSLRKRMRELVGDDMSRVTTLTFHGLALRLTGRSLVTAGREKGGEEIDFSAVIQDAIRLLNGEEDVPGFGVIPPRYSLVGRISHILVDEYQDIDAEQYELVALLAGKTLEEKEQKMTILAVGDDDQNIYRFRGANVGFIRKFHEDYHAEIHYLIENYRSTAHIVAAANALICMNCDRMKTGQSLQVNQARISLPPGGNWQQSDPVTRGRVQRIEVGSAEDQAFVLLEEVQRLRRLQSGFDFGECAVLAREWKGLDLVRAVLEQEKIPVSLNWGRSSAFPRLPKIRENAILLEQLRQTRLETRTAGSLLAFVPADIAEDTLWHKNLRRLIGEWQEETGDFPQPVSLIEDYFYEALSDQGRSKNLANGIFLSTVHSIKGLEFDHVFLLGDGWQKKQGLEMEEERRLYYVGMSRARETLHLFDISNPPNPHTASLSGDFLVTRKVQPTEKKLPANTQYALLGMKDLYLDFAGTKHVDHPVRGALQRLQAEDRLRVERRNEHVELVNAEGISVARLSKTAQAEWEGRLGLIRESRVVAIVRRYREEIVDKTYSRSCHGDSWEVPVVELCY
jgi:ATP-dependent DNA helicase RecQ